MGSAMLAAKDLDTHPHLSPWLAGVYVLPNFRRQGVATALVSRIIAEARSLGTPTLYLYTVSAERFFSRLGWSVMERATFHDTPVAVMSYGIAV
jgi:N-acetylglutamate synthase-like GNAT family acetyltransferase